MPRGGCHPWIILDPTSQLYQQVWLTGSSFWHWRNLTVGPHGLGAGVGTDLIPNLYNFVRDSVDEVIADLIVIPNMVAVPIVPRLRLRKQGATCVW